MTRIKVTIDRLVLNGMEPDTSSAFATALKAQLSQALSGRAARNLWARSHRTPVLKLGGMPFSPGVAGTTRLGRQVANAVARGLKP